MFALNDIFWKRLQDRCISFITTYFLYFDETSEIIREPIPEEIQDSAKSATKRVHQLLVVKNSPRNLRHHQGNMQTASLLSHNTSSDSENSDVERGKLMKAKKQKKNFSLGDSDEDDEPLGQQKKP